MLPGIRSCKGEEQNFPTKWQAVIFRNYGFVRGERIAAVLGCDGETVRREAKRLGLAEEEEATVAVWEKRGYITIIRNNWFLLPYGQMETLLGVTEEKLEFLLANEDFLSLKLGGFKPQCEEVKYLPLNGEEERETEELRKTILSCGGSGRERRAFDFFGGFSGKGGERTPPHADGARVVHGYLTPCGDPFSVGSEDYLPDVLLGEYARQGVNGLWFHGLLSALSPYPFDEEASRGYQSRRKELKNLIARCRKYGIRVYLYLNEPRGLPKNKIGRYRKLIGRTEGELAGLCIERKEVEEYLYGAVKDLLTEVRGLGGIMTITMSENLTHCNYRPQNNCPVCRNVPPEASAAKVNNIFMRAVRDSGTDCELIANLWGWSSFMGWTEEQTMRGIELLDRDVSVLCVSEYDLGIVKGGIESRIIDYSIGNPGPSEISRKIFEKAGAEGHKVYAKIQINNSWECSAVPYMPVYDLVFEHVRRLKELGVRDYFLTWTLGGFPSPATGLVDGLLREGNSFRLDGWYRETFGKNGEAVQSAARYFSEGLKEYPFSIDSLYFSPKTLGPANLWSLTPDEKQSCMVCYSYDDYEKWISPYPYEVYVTQYKKLLSLWEKGTEILEKIGEEEAGETLLYAKAAYLHFKSDLLQTEFSRCKRDVPGNAAEIRRILKEEEEIVFRLLGIVGKAPAVGFETSNHYFYTERNLAEKIVNVRKIGKRLDSEFPSDGNPLPVTDERTPVC
ncbi:MAG: hypothetical protein SOT34_07035 [Candidatus Borkfalkiaceae bacterium]|nr:hypothetical protein [Christensenellaceae bacterium]